MATKKKAARRHWCVPVITRRPSGYADWYLLNRNNGEKIAGVGGMTKNKSAAKEAATKAAMKLTKAGIIKPFKLRPEDAIRLVREKEGASWRRRGIKIGKGALYAS